MSDILEEIQALQEQFSDLCEGRKEGESQEDFKARLFQEKLPTLKAKRRNLDKQIKDDEKEYKETNKAIEDNRKESEEVSKKSKEASEKTSKAFNDYIQSQAGTELSNKLYKKYDNAGKKKDKLDAKSNELFDTRMAMHDKKDDIADKGREKVDKRNELNHLVARNTDYDNRWKVTDRPSFNKEIEKMMKKYKDSNSYNEIVSQIMDLKEAFTSLFEVDGLGNPAVDVPPSQNKIKRDRKTKDGKVEVVSVEDELFPYEGDKREQYRQKILAVINNMIQGTATLEDLLQLVRQKKAPLKEAMELAENLANAIVKKYGTNKEGKLEGRALDLIGKVSKNLYKEHAKATAKGVWDKQTLDPQDGPEYDDAYDQEFIDLLKKRETTKNSRGEQKTLKRQFKGDKEVTKDDGEFPDDLAPTAQDWERRRKKAPLKEALDLMETVLDAIKKSDKSEGEKWELRKKLGKAREEERKLADKQAWDKYIKGERKYSDVEVQRGENFTKNANGDRATRLRSARNNFDDHGWQKIKPEWKQVEDSVKRHEKKAQRKSSLGESLALMEQIINEISDKTANSYLEKRVINALDAWYNNDDLNKKEDDAVKALIRRKRRQGKELSDDEKKRLEEAVISEISNEVASAALQKRVNDFWDTQADIRINPGKHEKAKKKLTKAIDLAHKKADREGNALHVDIDNGEAVIYDPRNEALINELHPDTVNNALNKRIDQDIEADDKERDEFNKVLKIEDRDERAKAYKEFKKKSDDRFNKEDKKLDLYFNYAKKHPELVKESLRDQIDKKVKAGEINLDKALKLDKKIEDKMSSEKNAQEYSDELDKRAKKERLGDKAVAKSIRRNERKGACEALELAEAIINEVSLKKWKEAAANSIDKRKEDADNTSKAAEQSWDDYEEGSRKHPEEEDALYKRAWHNDIVAKKAEQKADHASDVLRIKAKGKSANKTIKAAKNSEIKRNDAYLQNTDPEKFDKLRNRMEKTDQLVMADPVKSRNEALEEAQKNSEKNKE